MDENPYQSPALLPFPEKRRVYLRLVLIVLLLVYVSSYMTLSRQGFVKSDEHELEGMWFFLPSDGPHWRFLHYTCVIAYLPLILIDNLLGTGREIAGEPTWDVVHRRTRGQDAIRRSRPGYWQCGPRQKCELDKSIVGPRTPAVSNAARIG